MAFRLHSTPTPAASAASSTGVSLEAMSGLVERVTFHHAESGFAMLQLAVRGRKALVTLVGMLPEVRAGEWVEAQGRWIIDREQGQQFKAVVLRTTPPTTAEGMQKYLASGMIKGIGPAFAARLVKAFGLSVFEVIEHSPQRLLEVPGIGKGRHARIVSAWQDQKAVREIMVFLHRTGVEPAHRHAQVATPSDPRKPQRAMDAFPQRVFMVRSPRGDAATLPKTYSESNR